MKNLLFYLLLFIPTVSFGQNEHIKFRDIELNGTILNFVAELKKLNYSISDVDYEGTTIVMKGKFIGRDCELIILSTAKTKTVWKVAVYFKKSNNWLSLKSDYIALKESLNDKYGKPYKSIESFSNPYYEGDGNELQAIKKEKCTYATFWRTYEGYVKLHITPFCQIAISYEDKINSKIELKEKSSKL